MMLQQLPSFEGARKGIVLQKWEVYVRTNWKCAKFIIIHVPYSLSVKFIIIFFINMRVLYALNCMYVIEVYVFAPVVKLCMNTSRWNKKSTCLLISGPHTLTTTLMII